MDINNVQRWTSKVFVENGVLEIHAASSANQDIRLEIILYYLSRPILPRG